MTNSKRVPGITIIHKQNLGNCPVPAVLYNFGSGDSRLLFNRLDKGIVKAIGVKYLKFKTNKAAF